jgi:hypothetical protein
MKIHQHPTNKYSYLPAIDFLEVSGLNYKEDYENLSPLQEIKGVKVLNISYSAIATV